MRMEARLMALAEDSANRNAELSNKKGRETGITCGSGDRGTGMGEKGGFPYAREQRREVF